MAEDGAPKEISEEIWEGITDIAVMMLPEKFSVEAVINKAVEAVTNKAAMMLPAVTNKAVMMLPAVTNKAVMMLPEKFQVS